MSRIGLLARCPVYPRQRPNCGHRLRSVSAKPGSGAFSPVPDFNLIAALAEPPQLSLIVSLQVNNYLWLTLRAVGEIMIYLLRSAYCRFKKWSSRQSYFSPSSSRLVPSSSRSMNGGKTFCMARTSGDVQNEIGTPISFRQTPWYEAPPWRLARERTPTDALASYPPWAASLTLTSHLPFRS
jgi:hypothetical protein